MIRLAAFLLGTLLGLTAHLALGYLWPVRVARTMYVPTHPISQEDVDDYYGGIAPPGRRVLGPYVDEPGGGFGL